MGACHPAEDAYDFQPNPSDQILLLGTVPADVTVELNADWQATVIDDVCAPKSAWPVGIRFPKYFTIPLQLQSRNGSQATWITWWDAVKPGHCGWQLVGINSKADHSTIFAEHARSIAPNRIAFTCAAGCTGPFPLANDNESEPVLKYCKFSLLHGFDGMLNPCAFSAEGTMAGPTGVTIKEQHILRPGQHVVRFILTDLEKSPVGPGA